MSKRKQAERLARPLLLLLLAALHFGCAGNRLPDPSAGVRETFKLDEVMSCTFVAAFSPDPSQYVSPAPLSFDHPLHSSKRSAQRAAAREVAGHFGANTLLPVSPPGAPNLTYLAFSCSPRNAQQGNRAATGANNPEAANKSAICKLGNPTRDSRIAKLCRSVSPG